ncbi:hypothetical protein PWT90_04149 [Aphanocladium album]|nr:hypothetical protein PWT90_04149 [Aphanocladium album]
MAEVSIPVAPVGTAVSLPEGEPQPAPEYAKNNINNQEGAAPDKGVLYGPVLGSLNDTLLSLIHGNETENYFDNPESHAQAPTAGAAAAQAGSYWLGELAKKGSSPLAPSGYQFYRNVQDFGAVGDGKTDDTAAINRAAAAFSKDNHNETRCAADCGSTTVLTAVVYFPKGTYLVSSPIIQYYHTQFVGDPNNKATIQGATNFSGIALVDNDFYIPGKSGAEWYINQSNFLRQIRNLRFDMRGMPKRNLQGAQRYVPTGIHWQVGQATSISNCDFLMDSTNGTTAMGIMMENGSGGVVSDLTFTGGNICFFAGSQQFTATNLRFEQCQTAIKQEWNWGFTWKNIYMESCNVGLDCTQYSAATKQGTGSVAVVDSHFNNVQAAIKVRKQGNQQPNIVLENLLAENTKSVISVDGADNYLPGSSGTLYFDTWVSGYQFPPGKGLDSNPVNTRGFIIPSTKKPGSLIDSQGRYLTRSKPQYESESAGSIIVATDNGVSNTGKDDQTDTINKLLSSHTGSVIFFPAGIYLVKGTVVVPVGSKIVGSSWSQIMGTGPYFQDESNPKVMVQVGKRGDNGVIEISDMLFTVKGATAGCILMEWNVHESSPGSAAMWDSHFRVGGAAGSDLQLEDCPVHTSSVKEKCKAASLVMHITHDASGYFDNMWLWVADHDLDNPMNSATHEGPDGIPLDTKTQISIYAGRGLLIESQGPTWLYGTSSEHMQMYQYELLGAKNVYLGHMQTETPYYQPNPDASKPYTPGKWDGDPLFGDCSDGSCRSAWALRILNSTDVVIYSGGFYSFFQDNELGCTNKETCQTAMVETSYSEKIWMYNIFTKGNIQIITPRGGPSPVYNKDTTRIGYTSEIAAWLVLALGGANLGTDPHASGSQDVYIDPGIWSSKSPTMSCVPPCTYILPKWPLGSETTIKFPPSTTSLEVGWTTTTTYTGFDGVVSNTTAYVSVTVTTVLTVPDVTTSEVDVSNVAIPPGVDSTVIYPTTSVLPPPFVITDDSDPESNGANHPVNTRTITPKPWPWTDVPTSTTTSHVGIVPIIITHTSGPPGPLCTAGCGTKCRRACNWPCEGGCDGGKECKGPDCTKGGNCAGASCTSGGDCVGDKCTRGGDCTGPKCTKGGDCIGPLCKRGGNCFGLLCDHGGKCKGPLCHRGGNCGPLSCSAGGCEGPLCNTPGGDDDDDDDGNEDFHDSNDPNEPDDNDDCTTSTFNSCRTYCAPDCSTKCSSVLGCRGSDTSVSYTATPAPAFAAEHMDDWIGKDDYDRGALKAAAQTIIQRLSDAGAFKDPPPTTTKPPPPTGTDDEAAVLMIVYAETHVDDGTPGGDWYRQWEVMAAAADRGGDLDQPCQVEAVYRKQAYEPLNGIGFPPDLGPFKAEGIQCQYKGDAKSVGTLSCDGYDDTPCDDPRDNTHYGCGALGGPPINRRRVHCIIYNDK